jgi:hypothetical protein
VLVLALIDTATTLCTTIISTVTLDTTIISTNCTNRSSRTHCMTTNTSTNTPAGAVCHPSGAGSQCNVGHDGQLHAVNHWRPLAAVPIVCPRQPNKRLPYYVPGCLVQHAASDGGGSRTRCDDIIIAWEVQVGCSALQPHCHGVEDVLCMRHGLPCPVHKRTALHDSLQR